MAADKVVEIDLTNDDGLGDELVQTSSRMLLTYVCEGSGSEPNVQTDSSEGDQTCSIVHCIFSRSRQFIRHLTYVIYPIGLPECN